MKHATLSILSVMAFVVLLFVFAAAHSISQPVDQPAVLTVHMSAKGFDPELISIPLGVTVTWVSDDNESHWPASDFHPIHTNYPGSGIEKCGTGAVVLDACQGLKKGETFTFTFDKEGSWAMHDHLHPAFTMKVTVSQEAGQSAKLPTTQKLPTLSKKIRDYSFSIFGKFNLQKPLTQKSQKNSPPIETANSLYTACAATERQKSIDKMTCYAIKFTNITLQNGPEYAFKVLFALQRKDTDAVNCHFIGHAIGYGVYAHDPAQSIKQIENISNICSYGVSMGIIEMYATNYLNGSLDDDQTLLNICGNATNRECNHGLGHGLLVAKDGNLNESLKSCSIFKFNSERSDLCYRGIFMEYLTPRNLIAHGLANESSMNLSSRIEDLTVLCHSYDGSVAETCWGELAQAAVVKYEYNAKLVLDFCNTAPTMETAKACKVDAVHLFASSHNLNITAVKPTCETERATDPAFENYCYTTLVYTALDNLKIKKGDDVVDFCSSVPKKFRGSCFKTIAQTLVIQQDTPASQMQDICKNAPSEYVKVCLGT